MSAQICESIKHVPLQLLTIVFPSFLAPAVVHMKYLSLLVWQHLLLSSTL